MNRRSLRYLAALLPALVPAAASAQALRPGQVIVVRQDTVVQTRRDTVVTVKQDTAYVVKYDTLPAPSALPQATQQMLPAYTPATDPTQVIANAVSEGVRAGILQALAAQGVQSGAQPSGAQPIVPDRPAYLKTWDKMQDRRRIQRVDRDVMRAVFVPKGQWMMGTTFNYQEWDTDNINLLVLKNIDFEGHTFSVSPYFGYFVANNLAVGARYSYHREYFNLGSFDLNLGEDFNISLEDLYYLAHTHEATAFLRTYMSLGRNNIFGFFGEIRGTYAWTTEKNTTGSGVEFDGAYGHSHTVQLSFCPGMTAFVTDFMAAEASIGVMGIKYRWSDQQTNRVETGSSHRGAANFKFNLLSINLGLTFYL